MNVRIIVVYFMINYRVIVGKREPLSNGSRQFLYAIQLY